MNRTTFKKLAEMLGSLETIKEDLQEIVDAEQDAYDTHSERWQESGAGVTSSERIIELESAVEGLHAAVEGLMNARGDDGDES